MKKSLVLVLIAISCLLAFSAGPSGAVPPVRQCSDRIDNDGDGLIDYPADPGCSWAKDNDETNLVPPAQCADTVDNDGDGLIDYPFDPGCANTSDNDEYNAPPDWTLCAHEGEQCTFTGTRRVRYGTDQTGQYTEQTLASPVYCSNITFGDPAPGYVKHCDYYKDTVGGETGTLRGAFTDFYTTWGASSSDHNGQIFENRWNQPNLQTLFTTQTPWSSIGGPAISQVNTSNGPGFSFTSNTQTLDSGSKKVEIYESQVAGPSPYGAPMVRGLGYTDEISFHVIFPTATNPSGFPGPDQGVYDRRNVFWQHSMDGSNNLDYFGISRLGYTNRFYLSIMRNSAANTELAGYTITNWDVQTGVDYKFHYIVHWANDSTGYFKWWVQRPSDPTEVLVADYTGPTWGSAPNTEFGFYTAPSFSNEDIISDIRVTQH